VTVPASTATALCCTALAVPASTGLALHCTVLCCTATALAVLYSHCTVPTIVDSFQCIKLSHLAGCGATRQQRNRLRQVFSRSHNGVIRVYDEAGNVIETAEHKGEFKARYEPTYHYES